MEENNFVSQSLSERQAWVIAQSFRDLHKRLERVGNAEDLADGEAILRKADRVVKSLAPILSFQHDIPHVIFYHNGHKWAGPLTDLFAGGGLRWLALELRRLKPSRGHPGKALIAACAQAISEVFRRETGGPNWQRVGEIVAETFPEALPQEKQGKEGERSLERWITQIVIRNTASKRKGLRSGAKSIPPSRGTVSDFFPLTEPKPQRSPEYLLAYVEALNEVLGGKDLRPKQ